MKKNYLESISLENYRNFSQKLISLDKDIIILIGPNGSGKTNILESISLLTPGKGLRGNAFDEICQIGANKWQSTFHLKSKLGVAEIISNFSLDTRSRVIKYNGSKSSSSELLNLLNIIWLTPQMEGLFLSSASARRRYFDRIAYNFDPQLAKKLAKYDYYLKERMKILSAHSQYNHDQNWLSSLEEKIAHEAIAIAQSREYAISQIQESIDNIDSNFPKASIVISQLFADDIKLYINQLAENRKKDSFSGRTNFGIHKIDFLVTHIGKNKLAKLCSTGEQKSMLISLTLAQINAIFKKTGSMPILLLDEIFVHLDLERRHSLAEYIINSQAQTFITSTEIGNLEMLIQQAQIINII